MKESFSRGWSETFEMLGAAVCITGLDYAMVDWKRLGVIASEESVLAWLQ